MLVGRNEELNCLRYPKEERNTNKEGEGRTAIGIPSVISTSDMKEIMGQL
jgi:hypothetical protein